MTSVDGMETTVEPTRLKRWEFRKKKKLEKRHLKRQLNAEKNKPLVPNTCSPTQIIENQAYQREKTLWEEREEKYKMIEFAKKAAREKQEKAKALSQKRWQDTLLNLPLMPPRFTLDKKSTLKTFVSSNQEPELVPRKTYRERFLEEKLTRITK